MDKIWNIISLGAGVQSSTVALMAAHGELTPMPDAAIFADTQAEPSSVYLWLDWLEQQLPFPVYRVTAGNLRDAVLSIKTTADGRKFSRVNIPFHTLAEDGTKGAIPHRKCTYTYKIVPILRQVRKLAGIKRGQKHISVKQWLGISLDEVRRMKPSREKWCEHVFPLIDAGMRRGDCLRWMEAKGYPTPPRSACVFCPYHTDPQWSSLKKYEPDDFHSAVKFEEDLHAAIPPMGKFNHTSFLHKSCKPLDSIDFSSAEDMGQMTLWDRECEGMCGV